jgi:hypothetical protein
MHRFFALGFAMLLALGGPWAIAAPESASAQAGTPGAGFTTPDAKDCRIEPRTVEELISFIPAGGSTPVPAAASPAPFVAPEGEPADAASAAGVTATAEELFACYNANDFLRVFALFTDDYLRRDIAAEGMTEEGLGFLAADLDARSEDERESVSVRDIRVLTDGRIGAYLIVQNSAAAAEAADYTIFFLEGDRFLTDDVVFLPSAPSGTPQP